MINKLWSTGSNFVYQSLILIWKNNCLITAIWWLDTSLRSFIVIIILLNTKLIREKVYTCCASPLVNWSAFVCVCMCGTRDDFRSYLTGITNNFKFTAPHCNNQSFPIIDDRCVIIFNICYTVRLVFFLGTSLLAHVL